MTYDYIIEQVSAGEFKGLWFVSTDGDFSPELIQRVDQHTGRIVHDGSFADYLNGPFESEVEAEAFAQGFLDDHLAGIL